MPDGTLSGSSLTMLRAVKHCVLYCDIPLYEAINMASLYPAEIISLEHKKGKIQIGYDADFVVFNNEYEVKMTFIQGDIVYSNN